METLDVVAAVRNLAHKYELLPRGETVVVGVSGGPDSLCLLHVLMRLQDEFGITLHAGHMEHGIRGEDSAADARFVADLAREWGLAVTVKHADVPALAAKFKLSLEEAAREARYAFLAELADQLGASRVAVGHNADDQVETVLMHWLRGAGLAGLSGMRPAMTFTLLRLAVLEKDWLADIDSSLQLIRPLLEVPRSAIEAYCREHELQPRFDRSNLDTTYFRNRLRLELIPYLETYNPNIREVIRRSATVIADEYDYLQEQVEAAWGLIADNSLEGIVSFLLDDWRRLPINLQRSMLRNAIHLLRHSLRNINWVHIENALEVAQNGNTGAEATLPQGLVLRVGYDEIRVLNENASEVSDDVPLLRVPELPVAMPGTTPLPGVPWQLTASILPANKLAGGWGSRVSGMQVFLDADLAGTDLVLRQRRPGDRFQPLGMEGHEKRVGDWMTNAKVPVAYRDLIPLLASPEHVLWIVTGQIDERAKITPRTRSVLRLSFTRREMPAEGKIEA